MKVVLNPDREQAEKVRKAVAENGGYCPCMLVKTFDTKCMCREFREQKEEGLCHCGLFIKVKEGD